MNLRIYISDHCWGCREARRIATLMRQFFPGLRVELIDLDGNEGEKPDQVFAAPTYMLNGRVVSLGNPRFETLREMVEYELASFS